MGVVSLGPQSQLSPGPALPCRGTAKTGKALASERSRAELD